MPKDATKNIDRYKIRGGQLNEFDFHRNQQDFTEASQPDPEALIPGTPPEKRADEALPFLGKLSKKATGTVKRTKRIPTGATAKKSSASGTAKKSGVKAAATKSTGRTTAKKAAKTNKAAKASKATKASKSATASKARKNAPRGATAKKLAARKAAKK